jgi:propionyl-CoA carboxylase beta chain
MDMAVKMGAPMIGPTIQVAHVFKKGCALGWVCWYFLETYKSGVIPQISAIMGPCAGGAVYSPAMTDFTMMVEDTSYMFVTDQCSENGY